MQQMHFTINGVRKEIDIENTYVKNSDLLDDAQGTDEEFHAFSICLVRTEVQVGLKYGSYVMYVVIIATAILLVLILLIILCIDRTSHELIRPLKKLNTQIQEILLD